MHMTDFRWELSEKGWDLKSAKEHLHVGSDGAVLRLRNLTVEERELVERYRDILEKLMGIEINIEEENNNG